MNCKRYERRRDKAKINEQAECTLVHEHCELIFNANHGKRNSLEFTFGGDLASTRVTKPEVHAEVQDPRKSFCKIIVANDDNYALAA